MNGEADGGSAFIFMKTIHSIDELQSVSGPLHLALGVFDGVHIGHQAVIQIAVEAAKADGGAAGVVTFEPHPIRVLAPKMAPRRILASIQHKEDLLAALGIDILLVIPFTQEFAQWDASTFLEAMNTASGDLKTLTMGEDWKFGRQRQGNIELLRNFGEAHGVSVGSQLLRVGDGGPWEKTRAHDRLSHCQPAGV